MFNNNYLMASEYGFNGIYRAKLLTSVDETDIRVYVPGINSVNPFNSNGDVDISSYEKNKLSYPVVQWCCYNLESKELVNIKGPAWVMFENGDVQRPVCISYAVIGGEGESSNGGSSSSGSGINGGFTTVAGEGVILIQGPVNDSRTNKYSDISQVPQTFTREWSISGCLSQIQQYANQSIGSNSVVPVAKAIINAGGAKKTYISALGINVVAIGNAVLCATTSKYGTDGDYLWAHFTDGTECLFVRFDEKSQTYQSYDTFPANEWGHWVDHSYSSISIIEICGMDQDGLKKTCDYIVNLGSFINNPDLAFKSLSEVKSIVDSKISKVNGGNGSTVANNAISLGYQIIQAGVPYVWGGKSMSGFDCSGFVWYCYNNSKGGNLSNLSYAMTTSMKSTYTSCGFKDVTSSINLSTGSGLITGDVLVRSTHTDMYAGNGKIIGAHNPDTGIYESPYKGNYSLVLRYGG